MEESAHLFIPDRNPLVSINIIHAVLHYFRYTIVVLLSSIAAMFQGAAELQVYEALRRLSTCAL